LVKMLEEGIGLNPRKLTSALRYQWYDATLLHVMSQNKVFGYEIFASLFNRFPGNLVFKFLDEQSSFWEDIQIMMAVPGKDKFARFLFQKVLSHGIYRLRILFISRNFLSPQFFCIFDMKRNIF